MNWIWVDLLLSARKKDPELFESLRASGIQQARFLAANLEYHLLANHLLKNAKALYLAGLTWRDCKYAPAWRRRGLSVLKKQLAEQILKDGGHFERSPTYHAIVLQDLLEVELVTRAVGAPSPVPPGVLRKMMDTHSELVYPDGSRARFNDSAEGMTRDAAAVTALCRLTDPDWAPPGSEVISRPEMGYFGFRDLKSGEMLLIDAGQPGPAYQAAHT